MSAESKMAELLAAHSSINAIRHEIKMAVWEAYAAGTPMLEIVANSNGHLPLGLVVLYLSNDPRNADMRDALHLALEEGAAGDFSFDELRLRLPNQHFLYLIETGLATLVREPDALFDIGVAFRVDAKLLTAIPR